MESPRRAPQACRPCKRLKRKCTKELPSCSLCIRLGKACRYPAKPRPTEPEELDRESLIDLVQHLRERAEQAERSSAAAHLTPPDTASSVDTQPLSLQPTVQRGPSTLPTFPPAFFLDPDYFTPVSPARLTPDISVPSEVTELIGHDVHSICHRYFATTHTWFPFVSPKRVYQRVDSDSTTDAGLALLLLCMKLDSMPCGELRPAESTLYQAARRYVSALEDTSTVSLCLLQALVMIALYELGHGIFPAVFLTVGRAARLGVLMSLHCRNFARSTQLLKPSGTWTPREEERRTWWATLVLERYLALGPRGIPLSTPEPTGGDLLPSEDARWNAGEIGHNDPLYITSFPRMSQIGAFAKTCQAGHMLGRVIHHRDEGEVYQLERSARLAEALQLHSALTALDTYLLQAETAEAGEGDRALEPSRLVSVALCCSAMLTLANMYGCNESDCVERVPEESEMQVAALESLKRVVMKQVPTIARAVLQGGQAALDETSPLVTQCLYHAASECQWFIREGLYPEMETVLRLTTDTLELLAGRWTVAGMYLKLLQSGPP